MMAVRVTSLGWLTTTTKGVLDLALPLGLAVTKINEARERGGFAALCSPVGPTQINGTRG